MFRYRLGRRACQLHRSLDEPSQIAHPAIQGSKYMRFLKRRLPEFRGYVDVLIGNRLFGWASDRVRPRKRLTLEVYCAGTFAGAVRADLFRDDLANKGIGDGRYGFSFDLPPGNVLRETIAVKVANSDFWLFNHAVASGISIAFKRAD